MFGEYWITYTANEGYGNLMDLSGKTFPDFIANLNHLHDRLGHVMPNLKPPVFSSKLLGEKRIELIYESEREGLYPMLLGLVKGLGKRFNHEVKIDTTSQSKKDGIHEIVLDVSWK